MKLTRLSGKGGREDVSMSKNNPFQVPTMQGFLEVQEQPAARSQPGNARLQPRKGHSEP